MNNVLRKLSQKQNLSTDEFDSFFRPLIEGNLPEAAALEFLALLRDKGVSSDELSSAVKLLRGKMQQVAIQGVDVLDTCGTGGDALGSFNISTAASFIVAGAGVPIAKHGNRAVSSKSGSADILTALGVRVDVSSEVMIQAVKEIGIGFFMAPLYHPSLKNVAGIRQKLGTKSIFNILGPLLNPVGARVQVIGVYDKNLHQVMAETLLASGSRAVTLVTGSDGLDELTLTGISTLTRLQDGKITHELFDPLSVGYEYCQVSDLAGEDSLANAKRLKRVLKGHSLPLDHCVHMNAALALLTCGHAPDFLSALLQAQESVSSGKAYQKLEELIEFTQKK